jgi:oxygen-independent coproporphyrinogen-3 oxidase
MELNQNIINKYGVDLKGPYYTSYPTLSEWTENFSEIDFVKGLEVFCHSENDNSFALYIHFPYCIKRCYFCICNAYITNKKNVKQEILDYIFREIDLFSSFFEKHSYAPKIKEIHLGGGSPSCLDLDDFELLIDKISELVDIKTLDEFALEIDPRTCDQEKMKYYATKGINRISFGIQDFNPQVQEAVNRVQSTEMIEKLLVPDIRKNYLSINFDLMYGLPFQTRTSFQETIEVVKKFSPDRIALLRYAYVPHISKHMRLIDESKIVNNMEKTKMFVETAHTLQDAGYDYIGIDNFAKPADDLAKAFKNKTVWRNFVGFTTGRVQNMIGIGPSATTVMGDYYAQNVYDLSAYCKFGEGINFPIERGHKMSKDDIVRREVIFRLICDRTLGWEEIEEKYKINHKKYFQHEIQALKPFINDDIINVSDGIIDITSLGKYFVRHVCKIFDKYLRNKTYEMHGT